MKGIVLITSLFLLPFTTFSQEHQVSQSSTQEKKPCPNAEDMGGTLCMYINGRNIDPSGEFDFWYQRIVHEAACVDKDDSEEVKVRKIQKMWKENEKKMICNNISFYVQNGNILKYAVNTLNDDFIFDVTYIWRVELNKIDASDNKTVLDYVTDEIERNKNGALESKLKSYYSLFRNAVAKHRSEL